MSFPSYYGWRIVAISAVIFILVFGSTIATFSLYVVPVSAELGLTRAQMNTAFVLINVGSAAWAPFIGRAIDRVSLRLILGVSGLLLGVGFATLALSHSLWLSILALSTAIAAGMDGSAMLTLSILVARWFRANRARAMTLAVTGQALGKVLVPLPTVYLIETFGWRTTLLVIGAVLAAFLVLVAILIRERPAPGELEDAAEDSTGETGSDADARLAPVGELLKLAHFWLVAVGIALTFTISATFGISIVPVGLEFGLSMAEGAALASTYAGAAFAAKLILAGFADKVSRLTLITAFLVLGLPLQVSFLVISGPSQLFFLIILYGLSVGGFAALLPILQVEMFGLASYGTVRGLMLPIQSAFIAAGALVAGRIYDVTGNYDMMFVTFAIVQGAVIVLFQIARWQQARFLSRRREPHDALAAG